MNTNALPKTTYNTIFNTNTLISAFEFVGDLLEMDHTFDTSNYAGNLTDIDHTFNKIMLWIF